MEFLLGNPFSTPVGHCIGELIYVSGLTPCRDVFTRPKNRLNPVCRSLRAFSMLAVQGVLQLESHR